MDISHMIVSAVVHGLVYDVIFKATRHMSLLQTVAVAVGGIGAVWLGARLLGRRRR